MSALGRWNGTDPLADKNYSGSPYVYVVNNSLNYLDPTGRDSTRSDDRSAQAQSKIVSTTSYLITGTMGVIEGGVAAVKAIPGAQALSKSSGAAGLVLVGVSIANNSSRENAVSQISTFLGGTAGGAGGGMACGATTPGHGGTACLVAIPGGIAAGTWVGMRAGDGINWIWDQTETEEKTSPESDSTVEEENEGRTDSPRSEPKTARPEEEQNNESM